MITWAQIAAQEADYNEQQEPKCGNCYECEFFLYCLNHGGCSKREQ